MKRFYTGKEVMTILTDILKKRTFCEQRNEYVVPQSVIIEGLEKINKTTSRKEKRKK